MFDDSLPSRCPCRNPSLASSYSHPNQNSAASRSSKFLTIRLTRIHDDLRGIAHSNDGEKDAKPAKRREDRGKVKADDEPGLRLSRQVLRLCKIRLHQRFRWYSRHPVNRFGKVQGDLVAKEFNQDAASSSQAWRKDAVPDESTWRLEATEEDQEHLNFAEDSKSRRLVASGNSKTEGEDKIWPHISKIYRLRTAQGEGFLNCETKIWSQSER